MGKRDRRKKDMEKRNRRKEDDEKIKKKLRSKHAMAKKNNRVTTRAGPIPTKIEPTKISKKQPKTKGEPGNTKTKSLKMTTAAKKVANERKQREVAKRRRAERAERNKPQARDKKKRNTTSRVSKKVNKRKSLNVTTARKKPVDLLPRDLKKLMRSMNPSKRKEWALELNRYLQNQNKKLMDQMEGEKLKWELEKKDEEVKIRKETNDLSAKRKAIAKKEKMMNEKLAKMEMETERLSKERFEIENLQKSTNAIMRKDKQELEWRERRFEKNKTKLEKLKQDKDKETIEANERKQREMKEERQKQNEKFR